MIDTDNYNVYACKDGRVRAYDKKTKAIVSYPKLLMENILGRPLKPNEDVHHKDGNPLNNNPWNLIVTDHVEHCREHARLQGKKIKEKRENDFEHKGRQRKYFDTKRICPMCGKEFVWTAYQQRRFNQGSATKVFCSKECMFKSKRKINIEIDQIVNILKKNNGNFLKSAKEIGMSDNALRKRLRNNNLSTSSSDYR